MSTLHHRQFLHQLRVGQPALALGTEQRSKHVHRSFVPIEI